MDIVSGTYVGLPYWARGSREGFLAPEMLRDAAGAYMHAGRYWDPEKKEHTSGTLPGLAAAGRAYSALPHDVDGDGDLDLIVGADSGKLLLRVNEGRAEAPKFAPAPRQLAGEGGRAGFPDGYAMPVAVDWDGDGLWDLVSGGKSGTVSWLRNVGATNAPEFAEAEELIDAGTAKRAGIDERVQIDVADYDADGDLDVLLGDNHLVQEGDQPRWHGRVWVALRAAPPAR